MTGPSVHVALFVLLCGCDDRLFNAPHGDDTSGGEGFCAVRGIFEAQCDSCHSPAAGPLGDLDLVTDPHAAIVDRPSATVPGAILVAPGDPDGSLLYRKTAATQGADEGSPMPMGSGLGSGDLATVRTWITEGATEACNEPVDTSGSDGYHPDGWSAPAVHGLAAKTQSQPCTTCHGQDLGGGSVGVSCDTCHIPTPGWRTTCTYCHGGVDTTTGAPPEDIDDMATASETSFPPHTAHVTADLALPYDCTACHRKPTDALTGGHVFLGDATAGRAEVDFSGGRSSTGAYADGTCSNLYCHGSGQGNDGRVTRGAGAMTCASCHAGPTSGQAAWEGMSGEHAGHLEDGRTCADCHGPTTADSRTITGPALHVDGDADVTLPAGITRSGATCNGTCHGEEHVGRDWD